MDARIITQIIEKGVKIKLSREKLGILLRLYMKYVLSEPVADELEEQLLQEIMFEQYVMLHNLYQRGQTKNTIDFTSSDALAFMMYWAQVKAQDAYDKAVLAEVYAIIDQKRVNYERITKA
jgi:hypothetical protein